jgi:ribosomal protein S27E
MSTNDRCVTSEPPSEPRPEAAFDRVLRADGDRHCPNCRDVALAFDPAAGRARCRSCGELA